jgi:hypothetical protein
MDILDDKKIGTLSFFSLSLRKWNRIVSPYHVPPLQWMEWYPLQQSKLAIAHSNGEKGSSQYFHTTCTYCAWVREILGQRKSD